MTYSWYNIAAAFNNNKLKWRKTGEVWKTVTFPDGMYDYEGLEKYIQVDTGYVDPDAEKEKTFLHFTFRFHSFPGCDHSGRKLRARSSDGDFADLIGFENKIFKDSKTFVGAKIRDITRNVDWNFIHCDLIARQKNDVESDVLYSWPTISRNVGYPFKEEPFRLEFHPVNKSTTNSVRIKITDGRNNILDLNGLDVALSLMIEEA